MRAVDIVEDAGFNAVEAVNADEAIAILESRSDISLLFSDIQMPGTMDGIKLAHAVHDRWPEIKIILVSGQVKPSDEDKPQREEPSRRSFGTRMIGSLGQQLNGQVHLNYNPTGFLFWISIWPIGMSRRLPCC